MVSDDARDRPRVAVLNRVRLSLAVAAAAAINAAAPAIFEPFDKLMRPEFPKPREPAPKAKSNRAQKRQARAIQRRDGRGVK